MSHGKKQQKKRKRQMSPPPKSQIARRLEKLRGGQRDLWADDDDDEVENIGQRKQSKTTDNNRSYIVLSDSEEERPSSSSHRRTRAAKSRKKTSRNHDENNKNATCLVCSILTQLSSYNCCSQHLSILKNHSHQQPSTTNAQWLPEQVMIVPLTDEIVQQYLDPQQVRRLRTQTSTSPTNKQTSEHQISTRKAINKSTMTLDRSEIEQASKLRKPSPVDTQPTTSTIVIETARSNPKTIPSDITNRTVASASSITVIHDIENPTVIDKNRFQQSPIQTIIIDDTEQENTIIQTTNDIRQVDPWAPISDEIDAALEQVLSQIDLSTDTPLEFTPATARRTETEIMAARLPKIPLKEGRFRHGKPINSRTTTDAANEYRPLAATQSPPSTSSVTITTVRSPPTATSEENESSQILNRSEHATDDHGEIATSCMFTQDEASSPRAIPTTIPNNEAIALTSVHSENFNTDIDISRLNESHRIISSATIERTTPVRMSFRLNPDGTRVSISRPPLPTNHQSPLSTSLRRKSTDVTPIQPNRK